MKIFICGFTGAGKSTFLEKFRGNSFNVALLDLDELIAGELHLSSLQLGKWIEENGFSSFRSWEQKILKELLRREDNMMVALGGGALHDENLALLLADKENRLIYLDTPFEICLERIKNDANRPVAKLSEKELKTLFENRRVNFSRAHLVLTPADIKGIVGLDALVHNLGGK